MATAVTETFMTAPTVDRLRMVRNPHNTAALTDLLGEAAYDEYAPLAERLDEGHLSVTHPPNLIFVPGVMGSLLQEQDKRRHLVGGCAHASAHRRPPACSRWPA